LIFWKVISGIIFRTKLENNKNIPAFLISNIALVSPICHLKEKRPSAKKLKTLAIKWLGDKDLNLN
jgi:hypothetical protein